MALSGQTSWRREGRPLHSKAGYRKPLEKEVGYHFRLSDTPEATFNNFIMKNKLCKVAGTIVFSLLVSLGLYGQVVEVGIIRNGQAVVTNQQNATTALKAGLSDAATISKVYIEHEPKGGKYYLIGHVDNDLVTGKAIELQPGNGGALRAVGGGPGLEITCTGFKCSQCVPKITKWSVRCVCEDQSPPTDMRCDMASKVVISVW